LKVLGKYSTIHPLDFQMTEAQSTQQTSRTMSKTTPLTVAALLFTIGTVQASDLVNRWANATKKPVAPHENRHVIHSYFHTIPESPDGKYVVYYTSDDPKGERGDLRIQERSTGKETIIADGLVCEDAHRVACQQWVNHGKTVVYHNLSEGTWKVMAYDMKSRKTKALAENRQLGFGVFESEWVPIYGCHWNPGPHRDFEMVNVETGEIKTVLTMDEVLEQNREILVKRFENRPLSIFFPVLSPDGKRAFYKIAAGNGGNTHIGKVSDRECKGVYDLENKRQLAFFPTWGHPSWGYDSKEILEKGNYAVNMETGKRRNFSMKTSDHPSFAPNGRVFVSDGKVTKADYEITGNMVVDVGSTEEAKDVRIDLFYSKAGAKSWRVNHAHPVFSFDSNRIYYNVNDGPWTRLMVAEIGPEFP
jgi:hypothetical protein